VQLYKAIQFGNQILHKLYIQIAELDKNRAIQREVFDEKRRIQHADSEDLERKVLFLEVVFG